MRPPWTSGAPPASSPSPAVTAASTASTAFRSPGTPSSPAGSSARWDRLSLDSTVDIPPDTPLLYSHAPYRDKNAHAPRSPFTSPRRGPPSAFAVRGSNGHAFELLLAGGSPPSSPRTTYASTLRTHRRAHRLGSLLYSSALFCLAFTSLAAAAVLGWAGHFVYTCHAALATAVFAPPMQPQTRDVEGGAPPFPPSGATTRAPGAVGDGREVDRGDVDAVEQELDRRLSELGLASTRDELTCESVEASRSLLRRYGGLRTSSASSSSSSSSTAATAPGRTLLALNLYNSEAVIPSLAHALLRVAAFLGPDNVHVSIFENGSTDRTVAALAHLARALSALGADHDVLSDARHTDWNKVDRIDQLAVYRNVALAPLTTTTTNGTAFTDVVFVNDVFTCPGDVLELLFQRRVQSADAACGMDWRANKGPGHWWRDSVVYYDSWVGRTLSGKMLRPRTDLFQEFHDGVDGLFGGDGDEASQERFRRGLPTPVYSCWNGMLALDARPFTSPAPAPRYDPSSSSSAHQTSWHRAPPVHAAEPARFRSALHREGECAASECKTLAKDLWSRGYDRWLVVPSVRATYDAAVYHHPRLERLASLSSPSHSNLTLPPAPPPPAHPDHPATDDELIPWGALTPPDTVVCWAWVRGFHLDLEWVRATWFRPYAFARSLIDGGSRRARP